MNSISQPLVSVVTPVYNEEPYISTCVDSVLAQTYTNWEFTIVNNHSTDRSLEIIHDYASRDARIRIHDNESFLAQVPNLNHALRQISVESKYCKMVLGDDWLFPECLTRMVEVAEAHPSVAIVGSYRLDDRFVTCDGLPFPSTVLNGREVCRVWFLGGPFVFGSPTSLLFRSDVVREREPFYNERSLHEDTEACCEILQEHDFGFVHQVLTFSRRENESISSRTLEFDPSHFLDKLLILRRFGRACLTASEYEKCLSELESLYYADLGSRLVTHRTRRSLLQYHRAGLTGAAGKLDTVRVIRNMLAAILNLLLNPKWTVDRLIARLAEKRRLDR